MEKLHETGGAVAGEGMPGFAGSPEPGTAGAIAQEGGRRRVKGRGRRFSAAERVAFIQAFQASGETLESFSWLRHGSQAQFRGE